MNTLEIKTVDKKSAIKQINSFRLYNSQKWYQINLNYNSNIYKMKIYDTWIQIFRNESTGAKGSTCMDLSVTQFKQYLSENII